MKHLNHTFCSLALLVLPVQANTILVDERDMKAALIYNFSIYTAWPEANSNSFNVCTFEDDQENINTSLLESKKINGKPIHFEVIRDVADIQNCQVLYVEEARQIYHSKYSQLIDKLAILTISENSHRLNNSSIINIKLENKKYNFTINNQAAKQLNLLLSSKLLRLASKVY
ncbi:MAG: YfiR family protein [Methylotenera sp.]|uniref:YfiR family protein n=1 Tax=Methylotenera sp. TaxID=2051956 RepID=UPI002489CC6C|nr:YfiR family protein [Methylotenera sp.]MDI1308839.1 YfiR family protein [Methylotenera sp.]